MQSNYRSSHPIQKTINSTIKYNNTEFIFHIKNKLLLKKLQKHNVSS